MTDAETIAELRLQVGKLEGELHGLMLDTKAAQLAAEMTAGHAGFADLLKPSVRSRLAVEVKEGGKREVAFRDRDGHLSFLTPEEQFRADPQFLPFLRGADGSRPRGVKAEGNGNAITRAAFEALSPAERMAHALAGEEVIDNEPREAERTGAPPNNAITRAEFNAMTIAERTEHLRTGGVLVDRL
jgi:hypothetical protein